MTKLELKMAETMIDAAIEILRQRKKLDKLKSDKYDIYECYECLRNDESPCKLIVDKGSDKPYCCPYEGNNNNWTLIK